MKRSLLLPALLVLALSGFGTFSRYGRTLEFTDVLYDINGNEWLVGTRVVLIDAHTVIEAPETVPAVGSFVAVQAQRLPDGTLYATRMRITPPNENRLTLTPTTAKLIGVVENMTPFSLTVSGMELLMDEKTTIDQELGPVHVGVPVKVKAFRQRDGRLLALTIAPCQCQPLGLIWRGPVELIAPEHWQIGGFVFRRNEQTVLDERAGSLMVGGLAEVVAQPQPDGSFLALRITRRFAVHFIQLVAPVSIIAKN